jgi:hypothetical protein
VEHIFGLNDNTGTRRNNPPLPLSPALRRYFSSSSLLPPLLRQLQVQYGRAHLCDWNATVTLVKVAPANSGQTHRVSLFLVAIVLRPFQPLKPPTPRYLRNI